MFAWLPWGIVLLVASLALLGWWIYRYNTPVDTLRWSNQQAMSKVKVNPIAGWPIAAAAGLSILLIGLSVVAARPLRTVEQEVSNATAFMIFDTSTTQTATDIAPSRGEAQITAGTSAVAEKPGQLNIGVAYFAGKAKVVLGPTQDTDDIMSAIASLKIKNGGSAIGEAIVKSTAALTGLRGFAGNAEGFCPRFVLMSDGIDESDEGQATIEEAVKEAKENCVVIDTVLYGTQNGVIDGRPIGSDPETLRGISDKTGGTFYTATSGEQLQQVLRDVQRSVGVRTEQAHIDKKLAIGATALWIIAALAMGGLIKSRL
jgi:Ca-activated chloride channel family protein